MSSKAITTAKESDSLHIKANLLAEQLPVITTVGSRWRAFDKSGCWRETSRDIYRPIAQAILPISQRTPRNERALLDSLEGRWQVDETMFKGALMFDGNSLDRVLINLPNGTLFVTPDEIHLREHDQRLGFTCSLAANYVKGAVNSLFDRVLHESLPDTDDRQLLKLFTGNFAIPDTRFEAALSCFGEACSGKDTVATPITYVFDGGNPARGTVTRLSLAQVCDPNCYALAKLRYACVNLCSELDSRAIEESSNFKHLVSGNPIEAREIRCAPFTMSPHCKFWALTNEMPRFKNGTAAELRRMRFLPFNQVVARDKIDTTIKERLKVACPGVLNFIVAGLQDALRLGGKPMPFGGAASREIHHRFEFSNDPVGTFIKAYCDFDTNATTLKDVLTNAFTSFSEQNGFPKELSDVFYRKLLSRYPNLVPFRPRVGKERPYAVKGLAIKPEAVDELSKATSDAPAPNLPV